MLNLDKGMGGHLVCFPMLLMFAKNVFYFVPNGKTIWTTFSLNDNVCLLWGIALAKGIMIIDNVRVVCSVASLVYFIPKLPWNRERQSWDGCFWNP